MSEKFAKILIRVSCDWKTNQYILYINVYGKPLKPGMYSNIIKTMVMIDLFEKKMPRVILMN